MPPTLGSETPLYPFAERIALNPETNTLRLTAPRLKILSRFSPVACGVFEPT